MENKSNIFATILEALQTVNENVVILSENLAQTHALAERMAEAIAPAAEGVPAPSRRVERAGSTNNENTL